MRRLNRRTPEEDFEVCEMAAEADESYPWNCSGQEHSAAEPEYEVDPGAPCEPEVEDDE